MMRRRRKRPSLLSRIEEEIRNFLRYYAMERGDLTLSKGIEERKVEFFKPPRRPFHPKAIYLIRNILVEKLRGNLK